MRLGRPILTLVLACAILAVCAAPSLAIVGGNDASAGEYPSVARITFGNVFLCSGTLISPNTVLTAGHCGSVTGDAVASPIAYPPQLIDVKIGGLHENEGEDVPVSKVTIEPNYLVNSGYDITLLTLSKNSTKTSTKVSGSSEGALWSPGTLETIAGWGTTQENGDTPSTLQEGHVPITTDSSCASAYSDFDPSTMICAGYPQGGVDTCQGRLGRAALRPGRGWRPSRGGRHELRRGLRPPGQARCLRPRGRPGAARVDSLAGAQRRRLTG